MLAPFSSCLAARLTPISDNVWDVSSLELEHSNGSKMDTDAYSEDNFMTRSWQPVPEAELSYETEFRTENLLGLTESQLSGAESYYAGSNGLSTELQEQFTGPQAWKSQDGTPAFSDISESKPTEAPVASLDDFRFLPNA